MFILHDVLHWFSQHWVKMSIVAALGVWSAILTWPANSVQIIFCNAGQGDETLIQHGFYQILLDSSRPGRALDCLSRHVPFFDRTIEAMVISHPQLDHFGGAEQVLERYTVMRYVYNGFGSDSPEWMRLSEKLREKNVPVSVVAAGDEIKIGDVVFTVLWPNSVISSQFSVVSSKSAGYRSVSSEQTNRKPMDQNQTTDNRKPITAVLGVKSSRDSNADALVLAMTYGKFGALFTSDIGEEEEKEIINGYNGYNGNNHSNHSSHFDLSSFDVLKVAHHGSKTSSSTKFLEAVRPVLAVIEVGKNSYGHPTKEAMDRLAAVGARVMRTDQDGDVVVETDGERWKIKSSRQ